MASPIVIAGGTIVDELSERRVDLLLINGVIAGSGAPGAFEGRGENVDASDAIVMPGLVDIQVHFRTPGGEESEDISSGAAGAALGGVTACVMMPNTIPTIDNVEVVSDVLSLARAAACDVRTSAAITVERAGERLVDFAALHQAGVRVFTDDGWVVDDADLMEAALRQTLELPGAVISQHAEHSEMVAGGVLNAGSVAKRLGLPGRPREAEAVIVERDIALAAKTGGRYHVLHMSTSLATEQVRRAKQAGCRVTAEVTPQHLILTEEDVERLGSAGIMNPPLRLATDVSALRAALLDGTVDAVATDHAPHHPRLKEVGLAEAPPGMLGVETMASVIWDTFVNGGSMSRQQFVAVTSSQPARIADIHEHGQPLTPGNPANIAVFDPKKAWAIDGSSLQSKSTNTPWQGQQFIGKVRHTICRGLLVVQDGLLVH